MQLPLKTPQVAEQLGIDYCALVMLMRRGRVSRPVKDSSGQYCWSKAEVAAARKVIEEIRAKRPRK